MLTQQKFTRLFIALVNSWIEPDTMAEIIATDAKRGPSAPSCIHNYIDLDAAINKTYEMIWGKPMDPTSETDVTRASHAVCEAQARQWEPLAPECELIWAKDASIELLGDTLCDHTPQDVLNKLLFVVDGAVVYDIDRCTDGTFSAEVVNDYFTGSTPLEVLLKVDEEMTDGENAKEIMIATAQEQKPTPYEEMRTFPNGFRNWMETHHEVVEHLTNTVDKPHTMANHAQREGGQAELYDLALELTEQFEQEHKGEEWGVAREYYDTIENWLQKKDCKHFLGDKVAVFHNSLFGDAVNDGAIQSGMEYCIDMRPNPHGDWSLIISNGEDLIDTYYYHSKEEAQEDVNELALIEIELVQE